MDTLLPVIKDKGYSFADNIKQDTLITRFYSSFSDGTTRDYPQTCRQFEGKGQQMGYYVDPDEKR